MEGRFLAENAPSKAPSSSPKSAAYQSRPVCREVAPGPAEPALALASAPWARVAFTHRLNETEARDRTWCGRRQDSASAKQMRSARGAGCLQLVAIAAPSLVTSWSQERR